MNKQSNLQMEIYIKSKYNNNNSIRNTCNKYRQINIKIQF